VLIQTLAASLQTPAPGTGAPSGVLGLVQYLPFVLVIAVFYFLLIAPARKQRQKTQSMLDALKTGDKVVTSGGLIGTIVRVSDDNILKLRIAPSVEVEITRGAVAGMQSEPPAGS
jgi:preprotein translocase subunit YajC